MNYRDVLNNLKFWIREEPTLIDKLVDYSKSQNNPKIIVELGQALISLDKNGEALNCLKLVHNEEQNDPEWNFLMGKTYYQLCKDNNENIEDLKEALSFLLRAEKLGSKEARPFINTNLSKLTEDELGIKTIPEFKDN